MHERTRQRVWFGKKGRKGVWKNDMKKIMNKKSHWDHMTEASMVERPIEKETRKGSWSSIKSVQRCK